MWRHGDVLIAPAEAIPQNARRSSQAVLAYGEITGHSHRIEDPDKAEVWEYRGERFLKLLAPTRVIYEEHQITTLVYGHENRVHILELLAQTFGLEGQATE